MRGKHIKIISVIISFTSHEPLNGSRTIPPANVFALLMNVVAIPVLLAQRSIFELHADYAELL